jgi:2-amino-4-hydroxy-6-hydroxymethyldihydropteridine diphosphokinase
MLERAFVMVPLAEIAPELVLAGKTVSERLAAMDITGIEQLPSGRDWWSA